MGASTQLARLARRLNDGNNTPPLANRTMDRGPNGAWHVPLGDVWGGGVSGTFAVKLHAASRHVYRLDVASDAPGRLGRAGTERVMASPAANSGDAHTPGYPYGLVDADRFAQVRNDETVRYGALLGHRIRSGMDMRPQHGLLNEVTS